MSTAKIDRGSKPVWTRTGPDFRLPPTKPTPTLHRQKPEPIKYARGRRVSYTGNGTSLLSLPPELHIQILDYLHWKAHIPCMQICNLWSSILMADRFCDKRYEGNGCSPRYSYLPGQLSFTITAGEITSVRPRIVPLDEHRYPVRDAEDAAFAASSRPISKSSSGGANADSIELVDSPLLDQGYFRYTNCPPPEDVTWNKAIRGFFVGWVCWRDPATGRVIKEDGGQSYFGARGDHDLDPHDMTVRGFLEFCRDLVVRKKLLQAQPEITVDICHLMGPSVGFLFYVLEVRGVSVELVRARPMVDAVIAVVTDVGIMSLASVGMEGSKMSIPRCAFGEDASCVVLSGDLNSSGFIGRGFRSLMGVMMTGGRQPNPGPVATRVGLSLHATEALSVRVASGDMLRMKYLVDFHIEVAGVAFRLRAYVPTDVATERLSGPINGAASVRRGVRKRKKHRWTILTGMDLDDDIFTSSWFANWAKIWSTI
ncbi:hypothetical protein Dda_3418 [Drechslerella dactyloides]|uniref:F-box domain-containing protein n=1 Tax=Drechslerella dactyloides TaxID=74499 RepID=A0AAD6J2H9_DREDA|nr:hypothetical protein Dda_3418 [Drechslerella dactyloides]